MDRRSFLRLLGGLGLVALVPPLEPPMPEVLEPIELEYLDEWPEFYRGMPLSADTMNLLVEGMKAMSVELESLRWAYASMANMMRRTAAEMEFWKRYA